MSGQLKKENRQSIKLNSTEKKKKKKKEPSDCLLWGITLGHIFGEPVNSRCHQITLLSCHL
jgi:hypothetical protein